MPCQKGTNNVIKLAVTDLDNTLIPVGAPRASDHALAAIHAMLDAGLHFGPVSGRVPAAMRWMFAGDEACYQTGAFVNGQLVYLDGKLVHQEALDAAQLALVGEWLMGHDGCALVIYDLDEVSYEMDGVAYLMGATTDELARHATCFGMHPRIITQLGRDRYVKANVRCDLAWPQMVELRDGLRRAFPALQFVFPAMYGPFIDILPQGWSKGRAVQVLMEHLGLAANEVVVFGDSENDLSMLQAVTHSVAVGNASNEVVACARHHIGDAASDAVADALFEVADAARIGGLPRFFDA